MCTVANFVNQHMPCTFLHVRQRKSLPVLSWCTFGICCALIRRDICVRTFFGARLPRKCGASCSGVYVCFCSCQCLCVRLRSSICISLYVCGYVCSHACVPTCVCARAMHACMRACVRASGSVRVCVCVCVFARVRVRLCVIVGPFAINQMIQRVYCSCLCLCRCACASSATTSVTVHGPAVRSPPY